MELERQCIDCGKDFTAVVDEKTGKVLSGAYWGKLNPRSGWSTFYYCTWLENRRKVSRWNRFWGIAFPWVDDSEYSACDVPFPRRVFLHIKSRVYAYIDRRSEVELWSCPECERFEEGVVK